MRRLLRTLASPPRQSALVRALLELCRVELALRRNSLQSICNDWQIQLLQQCDEPANVALAEPPLPSPERSPAGAPTVVPAGDTWALAALARRWPLGGGCLRFALAVGHRLGRRGAPSQLILGTRRSPAGDVEAHAWLLQGAAHYDLLPPFRAETESTSTIRPFAPLRCVKRP